MNAIRVISGPAGGNQGARCIGVGTGLIVWLVPPVTGALGVIGLSSRATLNIAILN